MQFCLHFIVSIFVFYHKFGSNFYLVIISKYFHSGRFVKAYSKIAFDFLDIGFLFQSHNIAPSSGKINTCI